MGRKIADANAAGPAAARANGAKCYPRNLAMNPAASQDRARPNLLDRDAEMGRCKDCPDANKTNAGM
jgi:hypothetical protein